MTTFFHIIHISFISYCSNLEDKSVQTLSYDIMFSDDLSKVSRVEIAVNVLNRAIQQLREHDYASAQVMVALARQALEDLQLDFDRHFQVEGLLKQSLK